MVVVVVYLINVVTVGSIAGGPRRTGSTDVTRELHTVHAGHAFETRVWEAAGARLMESCGDIDGLQSGPQMSSQTSVIRQY